ncbi:hypothetical protein ONZ45_g3054 [Pleurotus djamor]|nr:hypothetical protein ONZ45_g3054 [Pleurotus djamor]
MLQPRTSYDHLPAAANEGTVSKPSDTATPTISTTGSVKGKDDALTGFGQDYLRYNMTPIFIVGHPESAKPVRLKDRRGRRLFNSM